MFSKNFYVVVGNGKLYGIKVRYLYIGKTNNTISFARIVICGDKSHLIIYFSVNKKWLDFLHIKTVITKLTVYWGIIFTYFLSIFSIILC
ncbi:hypothetical protein SDC9_131311 [bioreactor metagenome]|uniref:Uncharacterized protein n=1 Tax=bioreactor metagenome TaxID=1076179 RepID=A0A645D426_9ZZZZ